MSDNFIPLNQSTPVQNRWQQDRRPQQSYNNSQQGGGKWRGCHNNWNNSRNSSYGSNSSNNSYSHEKHNIDSYLHPSMLQDPWTSVRQYNASRHKSKTCDNHQPALGPHGGLQPTPSQREEACAPAVGTLKDC